MRKKLTELSSTPHVLVIPFPVQGHVIPLLEFSQCLAKHGFRVTFVNSQNNHKRILKSLEGNENHIEEKIHLVWIPDGMKPCSGEKNGNANLIERILEVMPGKLEELIEKINGREDEKICCVIADGNMWWTMEVANKMKIRGVAVWPFSAATVALLFSIPKLMEDGIINNNGTPIKKQLIQLVPNMPPINSEEIFWANVGDLTSQKLYFDLLINAIKTMKLARFQFCNSTYDLEPAAFATVPKLLPIGPLLASNRFGNSTGYFWPENSNCLKWLDQQQPNSVIYVAFGSHTAFDVIQFQELALGLELCNRPFLWVVRPGLVNNTNDAFPEGFQDRIAIQGQIVSWAPQQKVLSHPSIACFLSHCGWNSTVEGVSNAVPFLCLPYFADQFLNESYICGIWKLGLNFERDESGIIRREEIKNKVDQVLGDENLKARSLEIKEKVLSNAREGGSSVKTFQKFLEWIKA